MTMFGKFIKAVVVLWTVAALDLSAQDFSSKWLFGIAEAVVFEDKFYR